MNDREWERARRLDRLDRWTTRVAWVMVGVTLGAAALFALAGQAEALLWLVVAILCALCARWRPALIKINDHPEDES